MSDVANCLTLLLCMVVIVLISLPVSRAVGAIMRAHPTKQIHKGGRPPYIPSDTPEVISKPRNGRVTVAMYGRFEDMTIEEAKQKGVINNE